MDSIQLRTAGAKIDPLCFVQERLAEWPGRKAEGHGKGGTTGVPRDAMGQGPLVTQQDVTMDATCFLSNRIQHGFVEPSDH